MLSHFKNSLDNSALFGVIAILGEARNSESIVATDNPMWFREFSLYGITMDNFPRCINVSSLTGMKARHYNYLYLVSKSRMRPTK